VKTFGVAVLFVALLAVPVQAQSFAWQWQEQGRPYLGDLTTYEAEFVIDAGTSDGAYYPAGAAACDDLLCFWEATGAAAARLAVPGPHTIQIRLRPPDLLLWGFPSLGVHHLVTPVTKDESPLPPVGLRLLP